MAADATRLPFSTISLIKRSFILPLTLLFIPIVGLSVSSNVIAETVVNIPRENGALLQEFKNLLHEQISQFEGGIGRIELLTFHIF